MSEAAELRKSLESLTAQIAEAERQRTEIDGRLWNLRAERHDIAKQLREQQGG